MEKDLQNLRLLGTINYVFAGILAMLFILPLMYFNAALLLMYLSSLGMLLKWNSGGLAQSGEFTAAHYGPGFIFILFPLLFGFIFGIVVLVSAVLSFYLGKSLRTQKNYLFCIVMSAIGATSFPFGTAVGIPSLIILMRPPVKEFFNRGTLQK